MTFSGFSPWLLAAALCLSAIPGALAHDLQTHAQVVDRFVLFEASYEGEEAASFVAVSVHAPDTGDPNADAYQTGRTDAEGRFVFVPNRAGLWRITVDDEMGHRATQEVQVGDAAAKVPASGEGTPAGRGTADRLIIGLSVLFGVSGLAMAFLRRRKNTASA